MTLRLASRIATLHKQERERTLSSALAACIRALTYVLCTLRRVHPSFGVGTVWGGKMPAVAEIVYRLLERRMAGARPGPVDWRGCEGRHKACPYGDLMGLAGRGLAKLSRLDTCHQCRHPVVEACC